MNIQLKAKIEKAIESVIHSVAEQEGELWDMLFPDCLVRQMTDAAELVFDSAQSSQRFYEEFNEITP